MTVEQMLASISSKELTEWAAYFQIENLGMSPEERADLRSGIIAATIANVNRGPRGKVSKPTDFMPTYEKPEQEPGDLRAGMIALSQKRKPKAKPDEVAADGDTGEAVRGTRDGRQRVSQRSRRVGKPGQEDSGDVR